MTKYYNVLPFRKDLVIPGYEKSYPKGIFRVLDVSQRDSKTWYRSFITNLEDSISSYFLPVCRLGDGEYQFCVGPKQSLKENNENTFSYYIRRSRYLAVRYMRPELRNQFRGGKDTSIPSGVFSSDEWKSSKSMYVKSIKQIAKIGIICPVFTYRDNQFAQQYFIPMAKWFKKYSIQLTENNYFVHYFVYALLNGPERQRILGRKSILIVTHADEKKRKQITKGLLTEGAKNIQFLQISKNRSLFDVLDLSIIRRPVDVILVGAGIGKPNILLQLKPLNTLTLDAGFSIECIADPKIRRSREGTRTFCWADFERNGDYTPI